MTIAFATDDPFQSQRRKALRPPLPGAADLAAMIADGEPVEALAETFGRSASTLRSILSAGGWSTVTGEALKSPWLNTDEDDDPEESTLPLLGLGQIPDWMDRGLCGQTDPEAFFPEKGGSTRAAKAICQGCPVAAECLDYALDNDERFGIWGGLSERDRRAIKKALHPETSPATTNLDTAKEAS